jgi:hypothetical protein
LFSEGEQAEPVDAIVSSLYGEASTMHRGNARKRVPFFRLSDWSADGGFARGRRLLFWVLVADGAIVTLTDFAHFCFVRFRLMRHLKSVRSLQAGLVSVLLLSACPVAHAQDACSDERVKDFFVQGGEQVIEDSHLKITSLSQDEVLAQSDRSLTCRYLMELSDHSKRWVRFTYSLDAAGQPAIDFEEESKSTSR